MQQGLAIPTATDIAIIAVFYTDLIAFLPLLDSLGAIAVFGWLATRFLGIFSSRPTSSFLTLAPLGTLAWGLMHASGVHATIAGGLLRSAVPVAARDAGPGLADQFG